jgi:hypothetical protein
MGCLGVFGPFRGFLDAENAFHNAKRLKGISKVRQGKQKKARDLSFGRRRGMIRSGVRYGRYQRGAIV